MDRRLAGLQNRSGRGGEEKNFIIVGYLNISWKEQFQSWQPWNCEIFSAYYQHNTHTEWSEILLIWFCIFIWLLHLNIEIKGYKKTKDSKDEIHDTHSGIQFKRAVEEINVF
jgi:hypothetical protein